MATATAPTPSVTKLPPGPMRHGLRFDKHVGVQPHHPVSVRFAAGGEIESNGIDFSDYQRMGCHNHKLNASRDGETPSWVLNDAALRKVLVRYMEKRSVLFQPQSGTEAERLQRAQARLRDFKAAKTETLANLAREYVVLKKEGANAQTLRVLAGQIENLDTVIRISENTAGIVLRVVTLYYRQGLNSVEVAEEVSLKPPHVRVMLWRLRKVAASLGYPTETQRGWKGGKKKLAEPKPKQPKQRFGIDHPATLRYCAAIKTERFQQALAKSIEEKPDRKACKVGHDLLDPAKGHIHVGDLLRTGHRNCRTCWKEQDKKSKQQRAS